MFDQFVELEFERSEVNINCFFFSLVVVQHETRTNHSDQFKYGVFKRKKNQNTHTHKNRAHKIIAF